MSALTNIGKWLPGSTSVQAPPANNKVASKFTNPYAYTMSVDTVYFYWPSTYAAAKVKAIVYSDAAGLPDTLLEVSAEHVGVAPGWKIFPLLNPVSVSPGASIWIGVISDTTMISPCSALTNGIRYNANSYASGPTATFGTASTVSYVYPVAAVGHDGQDRFGRSSYLDPEAGNYQPDREHGEPFVLDAPGDVNVDAIHAYVKTTSGTVKSKAAIFTDDAGDPGTKIAQTNEVTGSTADSWLELPFAAPVLLSPGTYWLCFISSENLQTPVIPQTGGLWADGTDTEATAFSSPSTLSAPLTTKGIDIYATYEAAPPAGSAEQPQMFIAT